MFYHLLYPLRDIFFGFNLFRYITVRAAGALITAFVLSIVIGPFVITILRRLKIGERIRDEVETPGIYPLHKHKEGTPTMGGIIMLFAILSSCILWARLDNHYVLITIFSTVWLGLVGFTDDYLKLTKKDAAGLSRKTKFIGEVILGLVIGIILFLDTNVGSKIYFPFFKDAVVDIGLFYIVFVMFVIVGTSNSVN